MLNTQQNVLHHLPSQSSENKTLLSNSRSETHNIATDQRAHHIMLLQTHHGLSHQPQSAAGLTLSWWKHKTKYLRYPEKVSDIMNLFMYSNLPSMIQWPSNHLKCPDLQHQNGIWILKHIAWRLCLPKYPIQKWWLKLWEKVRLSACFPLARYSPHHSGTPPVVNPNGTHLGSESEDTEVPSKGMFCDLLLAHSDCEM